MWAIHSYSLFFICCMWKKLITSYWGIICPWASAFVKTGKTEKPSASETCDCKASNSESLCPEGGKLLSFRKVLSVLMLEGVLGESLSKSLGFIKGETLGYVPSGREGELGATRAGLIGKSWNIFCCSNWAFCKVSSSNLYSCNKCSAYCRISGVLELPWNGRITISMRAHRGQKSIGTTFIREPRVTFNHCLKASLYSLAWNRKSLNFK